MAFEWDLSAAATARELRSTRMVLETAQQKEIAIERKLSQLYLEKINQRLEKLKEREKPPPTRTHQRKETKIPPDLELQKARKHFQTYIKQKQHSLGQPAYRSPPHSSAKRPGGSRIADAFIPSPTAETTVLIQHKGGLCNVFIPSGSTTEIERPDMVLRAGAAFETSVAVETSEESESRPSVGEKTMSGKPVIRSPREESGATESESNDEFDESLEVEELLE